MKKMFMIVFLCIILLSSGIYPQEKKIREDMVVINIEIPVRVMENGRPVGNLEKADFRLFEDGRELEINGFSVVKKKISSHRMGFEAEKEQYHDPRLFVLAFSVTNFNRFYEDGVSYLFDNVLRDKDKLLVFINNRTLTFNDLNEREKVREEIIAELVSEGSKARRNIRAAIMTVENGMRNLLAFLGDEGGPGMRGMGNSQVQRDILRFFISYRIAWDNYKRSFLNLDIFTIYNFAAFLKRVLIEKWVVCFYQYEKFPVLDYNSESVTKIMSLMGSDSLRILSDVRSDFNASRFFPYKEVSKMYGNLGTSFNLVVIPSMIETDSGEIKAGDVSSEAEITLREIVKRTGGSVSFSTDLKQSLEEIAEKEDVYYVLTYEPADSARRGELEIRLRKKGYKLLYDDNKRAKFIKRRLEKMFREEEMIRMNEIRFVDKTLSFSLSGFRMISKDKSRSGNILVNIIIRDPQGNPVFDEQKEITPLKDPAGMEIGFKWLTTGTYDLMIDLTDRLTSHKAFEYLKIEVQ